MNKIKALIVILSLLSINSCSDFFGSKKDAMTDEIFDVGKRDPRDADDVVGYAALLPFWTTGFSNPNDIIVGYDELVYVTDDNGLHVLDLAGRRYQVIPFRGANAVTMDRNLNVYVSVRDSILTETNEFIASAPDTLVKYDLPVIYKLRNANGAGELVYVDTLIFPFVDATLSTSSAQLRRLNRSRSDNYEQVQITGLATLADNSLYVTRTGPSNLIGQIAAPDNIVLEFNRIGSTEKMINVRQIRTINPTNPSLISGLGLSSITTFIGPPQRESMTDDRGFLITQSDPTADIPYRVLWIAAVETVDGLVFSPNTQLLAMDTTKANSFMYDTYKFTNPTDVLFTADGTNYIFVTDAAKDSLYLFQLNGNEGVNPPLGSSETKAISVSFGGRGTGPKEFNQPTGVAYFRRTVFVADKGNNRISRYKLTTDFE
ncbi:hypothetical protein EP331_12770 [bacterium]|nr:MAG: hypothetical protein EP331_12770 [bacterium]